MFKVLAVVWLGGGSFVAYWFKLITQKHLDFGGSSGGFPWNRCCTETSSCMAFVLPNWFLYRVPIFHIQGWALFAYAF